VRDGRHVAQRRESQVVDVGQRGRQQVRDCHRRFGRHYPSCTTHIAILTFEGFNELDSLIAIGILNRVKKPGWRVSIVSPAARVRSMNGVVL
jgi:hypothetical protein